MSKGSRTKNLSVVSILGSLASVDGHRRPGPSRFGGKVVAKLELRGVFSAAWLMWRVAGNANGRLQHASPVQLKL